MLMRAKVTRGEIKWKSGVALHIHGPNPQIGPLNHKLPVDQIRPQRVKLCGKG